MSTMTEPGFILPTASRGHQERRLATGHLGRGDDDVHAADDLVELGLLGRSLLGRQLAGVAAGAGRVDGRLELDELGAEALGLLARLGPDVVRLDHRAEPAGGADRLEPGHADAQDQHVGRLGRAGRGRQQREVAAVGVGRDEHRLVAADVGLRRQRVHRLGARQRARDRVEADRGHAAVGQGLRGRRIDERREQAHDGLARAQLGRPRRRTASRRAGPRRRRGTGRRSRRPSRRPPRRPRRGSTSRRRHRVSTRISSPAALSLPSTSGTRATRRSPGAVSLATPTFMGTTLTWVDGAADRVRPRGTLGSPEG